MSDQPPPSDGAPGAGAPRIYLVAGEASGDRLGAALMAGLRELCPGCLFAGVGGAQMQAAWLDSLFPMEELSVMGLTEVLPKYPQLRRRLGETVADASAWQPDVLVTIDSPDFGLRVARQLRPRLPRLHRVHYVAPTVWAWRSGRAQRMAGVVDQVLALFPFEPPYFERVGLRCDFVGHPVVEEPRVSAEQEAALRGELELGEAPVLLALPGSRRSEVARLAPVFAQALRPVAAARPDLRIVVPAVAHLAGWLRETTAGWPGKVQILDPSQPPAMGHEAAKRTVFSLAEAALAASGTVSLELARARTPMVVAYDMNWLSRQIIQRMLKVDTVTLVNLVSQTRSVPEFLGADCRPGPIGAALLALLEDGQARAAQCAAMEVTMTRLGEGGEAPGLRAARAVLDGLAAARKRA